MGQSLAPSSASPPSPVRSSKRTTPSLPPERWCLRVRRQAPVCTCLHPSEVPVSSIATSPERRNFYGIQRADGSVVAQIRTLTRILPTPPDKVSPSLAHRSS